MKGFEALGFTSCLAAACVTSAEMSSGGEKSRSAERILEVYMFWAQCVETTGRLCGYEVPSSRTTSEQIILQAGED